MNHKKLLTQVIGSILVLLLLAACSTFQFSPTPTSTPTPMPTSTIIPTESKPEWDLLTLGDSRTSWATWANILAGYIEEDLDIDVHLNNKAIGGQISEELLDRLRENEQLREQVREAEIVTVLTMNKAGETIFVFNNFSNDCSPEEYEIILEDIIEEIFAIRGHNPLIIRLLEHYNFPGIAKHAIDYFDIRKACFEQYNESVHAVAEKYNILVVPVYAAFNGPNGDDNPDDKGYLVDGNHLSTVGDVVIADLLRELGYDPVVP